jgi:FG-GAP repeat
MRRVALVAILVLAGSLWPTVHALASGATAVQATSAGSLQADFNNDGAEDLAVGVGETVNGAQSAGAVNVLYGSAGGVTGTGTGSQLFTQVGDTPEADDWFGHALATGDFNHDGFADLAASAPMEDVGSLADAGAVSVLYGSATGLTSTGGQLFAQVGGAAELEDRFGSALAAGDFNHDGAADLAASAPMEDVGSVADAGAVSVLYGSAAGLSRTGGQLFTQNSAGVPDYAEAGDGFGGSLAAG